VFEGALVSRFPIRGSFVAVVEIFVLTTLALADRVEAKYGKPTLDKIELHDLIATGVLPVVRPIPTERKPLVTRRIKNAWITPQIAAVCAHVFPRQP
jgi:hypothetical protein